MLRKIGFTLLLAASAISTSAYSIPTHTLIRGLTLEYNLPPNQPQMFVNFMFWNVEANCKIFTVDASNDLFTEIINRKATINDMSLTEGQSIVVKVEQGQNLKIGAESGAKVKITNLGQSNVKAVCST